MKKSVGIILVAGVVLLIGIITISAIDEGKESKGEELVKMVWADMKACDIEAIEGYMSPEFQSSHQDGSRNRDEQLELIKNLKLGEYTLSNFKVTENDSIIIVSYFVSVEETIEGNRLSSEPAARLSAFQKTDDGWKWIIHCNMRPLK